MPSSNSTLASFIDAGADRLARSIVAFERDARREREVQEAQFSARMAELETRIASVAETERRLAERLATLRDGENGRDGHDGRDGASVDFAEVERITIEAVERTLNGWPRPRDGKDGVDGRDGENGRDGHDGKDGTSVTLSDLIPVIADAVERSVAALPPPKDGRDGVDGKDGVDGRDGVSVSVEDVAPLITKEAKRLFDEIPKPKDGADGRDGKDGANGADGKDGRDGADGQRGAEGPVGKLPIVREWEDRVHYEGDVVAHDGSVWQASKDTGKAPGSEDWRCLIRRGTDGADGKNGTDGRSFALRGTWLDISEYRHLDVVTLNGAAFAAKRDNPGTCPGEGWQMIAMQGKRGQTGDKAPGIKGDRGEPGQPVVAATVDDEGLLTLTNGDGSTVTCDLYPLLSKLRQ